MHTARRNGHLSCHAYPLPCIPPAMHAPHHTWPPATHAPPLHMPPPHMPPLAMHAPCHTHPLPCITPAMQPPPCLTPATHAPTLPCMPLPHHTRPLPRRDRHLWKHYLRKLLSRAVITEKFKELAISSRPWSEKFLMTSQEKETKRNTSVTIEVKFILCVMHIYDIRHWLECTKLWQRPAPLMTDNPPPKEHWTGQWPPEGIWHQTETPRKEHGPETESDIIPHPPPPWTGNKYVCYHWSEVQRVRHRLYIRHWLECSKPVKHQMF